VTAPANPLWAEDLVSAPATWSTPLGERHMFKVGDLRRREFLRIAALGVAATQFGVFGTARAQSDQSNPQGASITPAASFDAIKQVDAGLLNIGYAEVGPPEGRAVILLHGWPYDIHSYADVASLLASAGYRVIVPYLRGYGTTRFLASDAFRNAQQSVVALDIVGLMDALNIQSAIMGGFDWGSRTAGIIAALWPDRVKALVAVSGYLITNRQANLAPLPPQGEYGWWYQYYVATERGRSGYDANRHDFNKLIWKIVSPNWDFDDATYERTAASFNNPDHVAIVIHNYCWRLSLAGGDPQYDDMEQKLTASPVIAVPTITIASDFDGAAADGCDFWN
jgi:pimeloyl-ACP methyl ester carboxylesterase